MDDHQEKSSTSKKKEKRDRRRGREKARKRQAKLLSNMAEEEEKEKIQRENRHLRYQVERLTYQVKCMAASKESFSRPNICFATSSIQLSSSNRGVTKSKKTICSKKQSLTAIDSLIQSVPVSLNPDHFSNFCDTDFEGTFGSIQIVQSQQENDLKLVKKSLNPLLTSRLAAKCEAKILNLLSSHPRFPKFYGTLGTHGLVMENLGEWVDGKYVSWTVHSYMKNFTFEQCIVVARQVCEGFIHLHDIGILHNDIKSNNIVVQLLASTSIRVVIIDFGKATMKSSPDVHNLSAKTL